jgi:O-antigen ligase
VTRSRRGHATQGPPPEGGRALLIGLCATLLLATLGEGGGAAGSMLLWHASLAALVLGCLLVPRILDGPGGAPAAGPLTAGALFLILAGAGAARAPYFYAAWLNLVELIACFAIFWLGARLGPELGRRIGWPLGAAALLQAGLILGQRFGGESRPAGTFLNTNHMAAWMGVVLLVLVGGWSGFRTRAARAISALMILGATVAVLLSGSRGALMGLAVAGVWLVWMRWSGFSHRARAATLAAGAVLLAAAGWIVAERLREPDPFRYHRFRIWKASARVWLAQPWWGSGPGQFAIAAKQVQFPEEDGPLRWDRRFTVTHSDLLRGPAEFGTPAALALFAAVLLAGAELRRRRRSGALGPRHDGTLAALLALAIRCLVDNPSNWPSVYLLACALLGSLLSAPRAGPPVPLRTAPRLGLALLLVLVFAAGDAGPSAAHFLASDLPRGRLEGEQAARLALAQRLNRLQPFYRLREVESLLDGSEWGLEEYVAAREKAEAAVRLQPADSGFEWSLARVEAQGCLRLFRDAETRERAMRHFERARQRFPTDPRIAIDAGRFLLDAADPHRAKRLAEEALRLEPNGVPSRLLLAEALLAGREPDASRRASLLLAEARELAERHAGIARRGVYQRELLSLNRAQAARVEAMLTAEE